jgi:nitrous oxide reductase
MSPTNENKSPMSRRAFARSAALAAATVAGLTGGLIGPAQAAPQTDAASSRAGQADVDATVQAILRRYGGRLSDAQKTDIRRLVSEGQKSLQALRAFPLDNADQPGNVLRLYPDPPQHAKSAGDKAKG